MNIDPIKTILNAFLLSNLDTLFEKRCITKGGRISCLIAFPVKTIQNLNITFLSLVINLEFSVHTVKHTLAI